MFQGILLDIILEKPAQFYYGESVYDNFKRYQSIKDFETLKPLLVFGEEQEIIDAVKGVGTFFGTSILCNVIVQADFKVRLVLKEDDLGCP